MTYGSIKVNNITYDNNGADVDVAVSSLTSASSLLPLAGGTLTGNLVAKNGVDIHRIVEGVSINASPAPAFTLDVNGEVIKYCTGNLTSNFNVDIRGDASTTFDSLLSAGEALTCALVVTNGSTGYYNNGVTVDGASTNVKWVGGSPASSATVNCITAYTFTVIKTATSTFQVLASIANFE